MTVFGQGLFHHKAGECSHKAVIASEILCPLRRGRREADVPLPTFSYRQGIDDSRGQCNCGPRADCDTVDIRALITGNGQPQALSSIEYEFPYSVGITQHGIRSFQFPMDLLRLQGTLGEAGAVDALTLGILLPASMQRSYLGSLEAEIELKLILARLATV